MIITINHEIKSVRVRGIKKPGGLWWQMKLNGNA